VVAQSIGRPHGTSEPVHALVSADIHHLEEIDPIGRARGQKSRPHAVGAVLLPGHGKSVACKVRQAEVTKLETNQTQATTKVVARARPESSDFGRLVTWVTGGAIQPGADDFAMLWLLFRTFLPQVGGLVLMLGQRNS
jgi:hypothetical protein